MNDHDRNAPYLIFMMCLSFIAIISLAASAFIPLSDDTRIILHHADQALCGIFFADFLLSFAKAPQKIRYLYTWGWLDLLSSIPAIDTLRWTRAARIVRILRVLRGIRAARTLTSFLVQRRAQSTLFAALLICLLLVILSAASILQFETGASANIRTADDALWWAVVTVTTVGYGDRFPVSPEGRVIGALLMTAGVGLFGTFSGFIASWFLQPSQTPRESAIDQLTKEIAELRMSLIQTRSAEQR